MKQPAFCPNPHCSCHIKPFAGQWFKYSGMYSTSLKKNIQRFKCRYCGRRFSSQTFSINNGVKKLISYQQLQKYIISTSGIRNMSRAFNVSPSTVSNRITRLARQSLAAHIRLKAGLSLNEDLVSDGFESFTASQYHPCNIHLLAGKKSQYLYSADYVLLKRKGRMTQKQKIKNIQINRQIIIKQTLTQSFEKICGSACSLMDKAGIKTLAFYTDEKPQYVSAARTAFTGKKVTHIRINSREPRTVTNDLFAVNYLDRELRKDLAEHVRESVQFGRNADNCMERFWIYMFYHNYMKPFRINKKSGELYYSAHAEAAGVSMQAIREEEKKVFSERTFLSRLACADVTEKSVWNRSLGFTKDGKRNMVKLAA